MSGKPGNLNPRSVAVLAGVAAGALAAACHARLSADTGEAVAAEQGYPGADVAREEDAPEAWAFLRYEGAPLVHLDGARVDPERPEDMPEPVRSFLEDAVWVPMIERVEVVKKRDAAKLYGPDAAGGVIHVLTQDPDATALASRTAFEERRDALATALGLDEVATYDLPLVPRAARTLEERQSVVRDADFLAFPPIVSIDGVRIDPVAFLRDPPKPGDIERIEVLKGPRVACAAYGEEASGIILIFTRGGPDLSQAEALLGEDRAFTAEELQRGREGCSGR